LAVLYDFDFYGIPDFAEFNEVAWHVGVLLGNGDGTFQDPLFFDVGPNPIGIASGDFSGDGFPDLVTGNFGSNTVSVLLNDTSWGLRRAPGGPGEAAPHQNSVNDQGVERPAVQVLNTSADTAASLGWDTASRGEEVGSDQQSGGPPARRGIFRAGPLPVLQTPMVSSSRAVVEEPDSWDGGAAPGRAGFTKGVFRTLRTPFITSSDR
jgi:hypothetical protein